MVLNFCYFRKFKYRLYYNALVYIIELQYVMICPQATELPFYSLFFTQT